MIRRWSILYKLLKNKEPITGAEIGVQKGVMTEHVLNLLPSIQKYYAIDPWSWYDDYKTSLPDKFQKKWNLQKVDRDFIEFKNRTKLFENKIEVLKMFSARAADYIENESLDFVFIDGNHSYKFVKNDIILYFPKVKKNGLLGGHDYNIPDVKKAVREYFLDDYFIDENNTWWRFI